MDACIEREINEALEADNASVPGRVLPPPTRSPLPVRRPFYVGGTAFTGRFDYATHLQLMAVADFLSETATSSVIFDATVTPWADGGSITRITLYSLATHSKTTMVLPTIICDPLSEGYKIATHKVRPGHVFPVDTCAACDKRLLRARGVSRHVQPRAGGVTRFAALGSISATDCGALYHSECLSVHRDSVLGNMCLGCPASPEQLRFMMKHNLERSFVRHSGFGSWLEQHVPLAFKMDVQLDSICCICAQKLRDGFVARPFTCDCVAHYQCALDGLRGTTDEVVTCPACEVVTLRVAVPTAVELKIRGGRVEEGVSA